MIRSLLRILLVVILAVYIASLEYPVHYYPDGSYGCAGAIELNTTQTGPWDQLCVEKQSAPSCAFLVIEHKINNHITLLCRRAYQ